MHEGHFLGPKFFQGPERGNYKPNDPGCFSSVISNWNFCAFSASRVNFHQQSFRILFINRRNFHWKLSFCANLDTVLGKHYNIQTDMCKVGKQCDRYKQVVAAKTRWVGCAAVGCEKGRDTEFTTSYMSQII